MRGRGHDEGAGFKMAGGNLEHHSRQNHIDAGRYASIKDRPSYSFPIRNEEYHTYNDGFLGNDNVYLPRPLAVQQGTGELNYFAYQRHKKGNGYKSAGAGIYHAKQLPNRNIRY